MLFLKKVKVNDKNAPPNMVFYGFVGNWKGIIPLDANASEQRSVNNIKENYGVNVIESVADFKEVMRYSLNPQRIKGPKETLSPRAYALYEGLKLK